MYNGMKNTMKSKFIFLLLIGSALLVGPHWRSTAQESGVSFQVIANSKNTSTTLSKDRISDLLLKKAVKWEDGVEAMPVDLVDSDVREAFSRDIHGRSVASIKNYWQRQIFSGGKTPPPELDEEDVVDHVSKNRGGIGYVGVGYALRAGSGVKVIKVADQ